MLTAGSVDDGKSTLIGRLLLDGQSLLADQVEALRGRGTGADASALDLALATDGLEAEREQGITIDVAHRYFTTPARKFVIADAPGHEQYTRNMVTAAAGSDAAVVLVDATKLGLDDVDGVGSASPLALLPQTRRHALIARLLGVPSLLFAVNKLDAVADPGAAFERVRAAIAAFARDAGIVPAGIVPISALHGDNVTRPSAFVAGYDGPTLLALLESLPAAGNDVAGTFALPVQYVDAGGHDTAGQRSRVLWGRIARGAVAAGDEVVAWPSGQAARVVALYGSDGRIDAAPGLAAGSSAGIALDRPLDVSRGDWLAAPAALVATDRFGATLAWLDIEPARAGRKYLLRHGNRWQAAFLTVQTMIDIATLAAEPATTLVVNGIGRVVVETQQPLPLAPFTANRTLGALVVVDPATNRTSGVLLVDTLSPS